MNILKPETRERLRTMSAETVKEWRQQWKEEGLREGRNEGLKEGQIKLLLKQLELKFGPLSTELRKRVQTADTETLSMWSERILTAHTLREVIDDSL